jgi:hypothetical protein
VADVVVEWQGITIGGGTNQYTVQTITGWDDLPEVITYDQERARGHGDHVGDMFARARIVTVEGTIADPAERDALAQALAAVSLVRSDVTDLTVTTFGTALTTGARLIRRSLPVGLRYGAGLVPFALQWRCPDPLRYGQAQSAKSTGLPTSGGGLTYPLTYPLDYGAAGDPGQVTLTNDGTAEAPIVFTVSGPLPSGWQVSAGDQRLIYPVEVPAGETLTVDTAAGTIVAQGTADRRANLTVADWIVVPAVSSVTLQFASLGGAYDPAAVLTVPGFRSASW